jgi:organic radical activating enzyme
MFVRLAGCDLSCAYCDTVHHVFTEMDVSKIWHEIEKTPHHYETVSLTGGEPLCQPEVVNELGALIRKHGKKVLLETHGANPEGLKQVIHNVDIVAMDIKLPSSAKTPELWESSKEFLRIALEAKKDTFVKLAVTPKTKADEILRAAQIVAATGKHVTVYLQPVHQELKSFTVQQMLAMCDLVAQYVSDVRIVGQMHKYFAVP